MPKAAHASGQLGEATPDGPSTVEVFSSINTRTHFALRFNRGIIAGTQIREKNDKFQQRKLNTMLAARTAVREASGDADMEVTIAPHTAGTHPAQRHLASPLPLWLPFLMRIRFLS